MTQITQMKLLKWLMATIIALLVIWMVTGFFSKPKLNRVEWMNKVEYKEWRAKVFARDNYTCQNCDKRGGKLHAHHIIPVSADESKIVNVDNGITLCKKCHSKTIRHEKEYEEYFKEILMGKN